MIRNDKYTDEVKERMNDEEITRNKQAEKKAGHQRLVGKVVLLVGNDTAVLQNLVIQLAQKGADVALLCCQLPLEAIRHIKESVQSVGRQLLLFDQARSLCDSKQMIKMIKEELGSLDVFIDLSAKKMNNQPSLIGNGTPIEIEIDEAHWSFTQTMLKELA